MKKIKEIIKPSVVPYAQLTESAQRYIFKIRLLVIASLILTCIITVASRNVRFLLLIPVLAICFFVYYLYKVRPFYGGKVKVLHGTIVADEGGEAVRVPMLGKRFTRRDLAIKNGDIFFVTTISSNKKFHFDDEVDIYLLESDITPVNDNTFKIFDYFFIVKTATYFKK